MNSAGGGAAMGRSRTAVTWRFGTEHTWEWGGERQERDIKDNCSQLSRQENLYRVSHLLVDWVGMTWTYTVCPILLRLM